MMFDLFGLIGFMVVCCVFVDWMLVGFELYVLVVWLFEGVWFGVLMNYVMDGVDVDVVVVFDIVFKYLEVVGVIVIEVCFFVFDWLLEINCFGFLLIEVYVWYCLLFVMYCDQYDLCVLMWILKGEFVSVVDYFDLFVVCVVMFDEVVYMVWLCFDVFVVLMVLVVLLCIVEFEMDDDVFMCINVLILCNLSVFNFFDVCGLLLLCYLCDVVLVGLMFVVVLYCDDVLFVIGQLVEVVLNMIC